MAQEFNIGQMKAEAIAKAFGIDIEKGRHGVYEDNAENRRLNRVGQEYGKKAEEKQTASKQPKQGEPTEQQKKTSTATMESAAQGASDEALKRASQDPKAPEDVKAAAKKELANRGSGEGKEDAAKDGGKGKKSADENKQESKNINSAAGEMSKILDPLDDWEDDDWNDADKNAELFSQIRSVISKYDMSEDEFRAIAKKYPGLDLVYTDYAPHEKVVPIAKSKIRAELNKFDDFSDDDWNDPSKQDAITDKLTFYIRHYNISEDEWNEIVKPYADGLSGLPYSDFQ